MAQFFAGFLQAGDSVHVPAGDALFERKRCETHLRGNAQSPAADAAMARLFRRGAVQGDKAANEGVYMDVRDRICCRSQRSNAALMDSRKAFFNGLLLTRTGKERDYYTASAGW